MEFKCLGKIIQSKGGMDGWLEEGEYNYRVGFMLQIGFWMNRIYKGISSLLYHYKTEPGTQ